MKLSHKLSGALAALTLLATTPAAAATEGPAYDHGDTTVVGPTEQQSFSTAAAGSGDDIVFNGAGSHHSVGLSQYGARGQAQEGRNETQITRTYYSGTDIESRPAPYDIRVGVVRDTPRIRYVPRGGDAAVFFKVGDIDPVTAGRDTAWRVDVLGDDRCRTRGPGFDHTGTCPAFDPNGQLEVQTPNGSSWNRYRSYGQDAIVRTIADRPGSSWLLDIVVELSLETYLYGLAEVPYSWESEALQAQAIAGRSFALHRMLDTGPPEKVDRGCSCHVWDSQRDQVYAGYDREVSARWSSWKAAVDATANRVVVADPGQTGFGDTADGIVQTFYSASSHGRTESKHESPAFSSGRWDYMLTVADNWSLSVDGNPYASWSRTVPRNTVAARVGLSSIDDVEVVARNTSGSARTVRFTGSGRTKDLSADEVRRTFGLLSNGFSVGTDVFFPRDVFIDDDSSIHEEDIDWLAGQDITKGCNPPTNDRYCPGSPVTREQMASFLTRALNLPDGTERFADVADGSTHAADIGALARAEITLGCNPPTNDRYCPGSPVTREQMASFLTRALNLTPTRESFADVPDGGTHARDIGALAQAGITLGCNPPTNDRFCPTDPVTREQMASFLRRAGALLG